MARLTKGEWKAARERWESDPSLSFTQLAFDLGVTRPAVGQTAASQGWKKRGGTGNARPKRPGSSPIPAGAARVGFIYVLEAEVGEFRYHKIGRALSVQERLSTHQTSSPLELRVAIAYMTQDMVAEEQVVHSLFAHKAVRGEWFQLDTSDLETIASRSFIRG